MEDFEANKMKPITIGYYDDDSVYLLPGLTWHVLQRYCTQENTHFPFSKGTFFKMLKDKGVIAPSSDGQPTIQKKINGKNQRVLKVVSGGICDYFVTSVTDKTSN